jgi:hypothetical protein
LRRVNLLRVARAVARGLGADECLLVGGLAVGAYGYVRATRDVDFVTRLPLKEAQRRLREQGIATSLVRRDPVAGDFSCLRGVVEGVRVDVLPPLVPLAWDQGIDIEGTRSAGLRVVDLDGLLSLKMRAGGPKDLMDAAALLAWHPDHLERGRELAVAYRVADALDAWLEDPRLKADIRRMRASESRRRARPRKASPKR